MRILEKHSNYKSIKGVIFDFDGTLVISPIPFKETKEKILKEARKRNLRFAEELPILELLDFIKRENGKKGKDFFVIGQKILKEQEIKAGQKTELRKDVLETLTQLKRNNIKIGIITRNCKEAVINVINKFSIPYDVLLTRDDIKKVKPDIYHVKKCLKLMSLRKEEVILVGDHPFDIRCGKKLNIKTIGIKSENIEERLLYKEGADFLIDEISDIEYLIGLKSFKQGKLPNRFLIYLLKKYIDKNKDIISTGSVGNDCAIFKTKTNIIFAKTDPITLTSEDIGFYLVNINANDIVVTGGIPKYFLCTLFFPSGIKFPEIENVFLKIREECNKLNIKWVGGHTEIMSDIKTPVSVGFMLGEKIKKFDYSDIKEGDKVFLVKEIGIEGASILVREKYKELKRFFSERYLKKIKNSIYSPGISVFKEGVILWKKFKIKFMHDPTEGGISTGLYEISENKNIGILLDIKKLKFYKPVIKLCKIFNLNPFGIISSGCIVGITDRNEAEKMIDFSKKRGIKMEIIGEVVKRKGVFYYEKNEKRNFLKFERDEINKIF
ncbi:MAG: HAD-IA family hydrolase [Candidatus Omnitrophica bacterium]|nr:HAD-IA family hydrolase [Candidatus Omnitrophota bacterium]MCM8801973.1 HAD-IA family hydrolase [Candidatus Omnitrophota bacterium]